MPVIRDAVCNKCGKTFTALGSQDICNKCIKKELKSEKVDWLAERRYDEKEDRPKTIEERIDWIEEWIYENRDTIEKVNVGKYI